MPLGGRHPGLGDLQRPLAPIDLYDGFEVVADEDQEARPHHPDNHHHEDGNRQRDPGLVFSDVSEHHPVRFLNSTSVVSVCVAASESPRSTSTVSSIRTSFT